MKRLERDQLIMRLHHAGQTYAEVGRHPEVRLGERQVQRIVKEMEARREEEIRKLTTPAALPDGDVDPEARALELVDALTEGFARVLDLLMRFDQPLREGFVAQLSKRNFERRALELRRLVEQFAAR